MHCIGRCTFIPLSSIIIISFHSGYSITGSSYLWPDFGPYLCQTTARFLHRQWPQGNLHYFTVSCLRHWNYSTAQQEYGACGCPHPGKWHQRERDFKSAEADEDIDLIRQWATCLGPSGGSVLIASTLDHHPLCLPCKWIIYMEQTRSPNHQDQLTPYVQPVAIFRYWHALESNFCQ